MTTMNSLNPVKSDLLSADQQQRHLCFKLDRLDDRYKCYSIFEKSVSTYSRCLKNHRRHCQKSFKRVTPKRRPCRLQTADRRPGRLSTFFLILVFAFMFLILVTNQCSIVQRSRSESQTCPIHKTKNLVELSKTLQNVKFLQVLLSDETKTSEKRYFF